MKLYKKHTLKMTMVMALLVVMLVGITACGSNENSNTADFGKQSETEENSVMEDPANEILPLSTLEESEAWLLYSDGSYAEVLIHVPEGKVSAQVCQKDGSDIKVNGEQLFFGTRKLIPGWSLEITNSIPSEYTMEDLAITLTWSDGEKTSDGSYPSILITDFEDSRTEEELRASGFVVWDDHYAAMLETRTTYGSGSSTDLDTPSFGLFFEMYPYGKDWASGLKDIEGLSEQLAFYAGDGTPLEEYFEGFDSIAIEINDVTIYALIYQSEGASYDESQYKEMCNELRACTPYMILTEKDGTVQKFTLFDE